MSERASERANERRESSARARRPNDDTVRDQFRDVAKLRPKESPLSSLALLRRRIARLQTTSCTTCIISSIIMMIMPRESLFIDDPLRVPSLLVGKAAPLTFHEANGHAPIGIFASRIV